MGIVLTADVLLKYARVLMVFDHVWPVSTQHQCAVKAQNWSWSWTCWFAVTIKIRPLWLFLGWFCSKQLGYFAIAWNVPVFGSVWRTIPLVSPEIQEEEDLENHPGLRKSHQVVNHKPSPEDFSQNETPKIRAKPSKSHGANGASQTPRVWSWKASQSKDSYQISHDFTI